MASYGANPSGSPAATGLSSDPSASSLRASGLSSISPSAWYGLLVLSIINIYAVIDRSIFSLLAEPIKRDMGLSDTQLGLLQGVGLTIVGVVTIYPTSWLGDRMDRRWISAAAILLWSIAVVGCGFSPGFASLLFFASLVGIGENARAPVAFAMLPDLFPLSGRQLGNSIYTFVSVMANSLAAYVTGLIVTEIGIVRPFLPKALATLPDWRLSMLAAAFFVPVAIVMTLTMPARTAGPGRRGLASASARAVATPQPASPAIGIWQFIWEHRAAQFGFNIGFMILTFGIAAGSNWLAVIMMRDFHQTAAQIGGTVAILAIVNAAIGFTLAGLVLGRLQPRYGALVPMMALTIASALAVIASLLLATAGSVTQMYIYFCLLSVVLMIGTMTYPTILQNMTLPHLRARIFALTVIAQLVAGGIGTLSTGVLSDALKKVGVSGSLLIGGSLISAVCAAAAAVVFWRSRHAYMRLTERVLAEQAID